MIEPYHLEPPLSADDVKILRYGDPVLITGFIYTARDSAHKRLIRQMDAGEELPIPIKGEIIYYVGPSPTRPGRIFGSAGPTTSYRMDPYTPRLLQRGLKAMIGKGRRSKEVRKAIQRHKAVYLAAIGGAGAMISMAVKSAEVVAYDDLGPEAIFKLKVEEFPAIVINDIVGNDLYISGQKMYQKNGVP
jgi:fumarate hydratase subunit beta